MVDHAPYPIHSEVEQHVHLIRGGNNARFPQANCLLIDDDTLTLVDAGADIRHIEATLRDFGHSLKDIDLIVLTHFHVDHKGHATQLQQVSECEVICHPLAERGVKTFSGLVDCYGIEGHRCYQDWMGLLHERLPHVMSDYTVTGLIDMNRTIDLGECVLHPICAPGHTPDHICIGINGYETIFLTDIDLTRFGPWYGNVVSDIPQFRESIKNIISLRPRVGISSHLVDPVRDGLELELKRYMAVFDQREKRIVERLSAGYDTIDALAALPTIYPRLPQGLYIVFEEFMLRKHVEELVRRGVAYLDGNRIRLVERG
ncbi:MAG: MBL fold metallo-hydrolase [Candidatus Thorarchaeota archaeon]|nr:MBL fold metallo-hydrolase [Candidatus Thorarchaeota archaeon]